MCIVVLSLLTYFDRFGFCTICTRKTIIERPLSLATSLFNDETALLIGQLMCSNFQHEIKKSYLYPLSNE